MAVVTKRKQRSVVARSISAALFAMGLAAILACGGQTSRPVPPSTQDGPNGTGQASGGSAANPIDPQRQIKLVFPYGSEKKIWLTQVTNQFNRSKQKTKDGKEIVVEAIAMGSGESVDEILSGRIKAHLVSPASGAFIALGNARSQADTGKDFVGPTRELVLSPVVIAMWKPMAEAIGWGKKPIGWSDILELARSDEGWAAYNYPQWGQFKFGHTHPEFSNSGIISLFAEVYASTGKKGNLQLEDVAKPETAEFLREIEQSVVHYGSSTGFFGRKLFGNGPEYLSAAVLYENMVIESYDRRKYRDLPFPVVAIYPKEGTFWSDHPVGIVQRDWVTEEHQEAAQLYIDFLLAKEQQALALQSGFRPSDLTVQLTAPLDHNHGIDPDEPKTTLEVPSVPVMDAIIKLWKEHKKHANVTLVLDTSGSMKGERLRGAKQGALELIGMLGEQDTMSFMAFNNRTNWVRQDVSMKTGRDQLKKDVQAVFADGGTALYDAVAKAHEYMSQHAQPDKIEAIVVLTDGADTNSRLKLPALLDRIRYDGESRKVRVFTIGYGKQAEAPILQQISDETQAKFSKGAVENIREIFKDISTFF